MRKFSIGLALGALALLQPLTTFAQTAPAASITPISSGMLADRLVNLAGTLAANLDVKQMEAAFLNEITVAGADSKVVFDALTLAIANPTLSPNAKAALIAISKRLRVKSDRTAALDDIGIGGLGVGGGGGSDYTQ
ncbi:hypothetical protein [Caulobacter sp. LARHSG274]